MSLDEKFALLGPEQGKLTDPLQALGGESNRLTTVKYALDDVRRQEGKLQRARRVTDVDPVAFGEIADAERTAGS